MNSGNFRKFSRSITYMANIVSDVVTHVDRLSSFLYILIFKGKTRTGLIFLVSIWYQFYIYLFLAGLIVRRNHRYRSTLFSRNIFELIDTVFFPLLKVLILYWKKIWSSINDKTIRCMRQTYFFLNNQSVAELFMLF